MAQQRIALTMCCEPRVRLAGDFLIKSPVRLADDILVKSMSLQNAPTILGTAPLEKNSSEHQQLPQAWATRRRLPSALIIGVRKGGTRALLEFLSIHPNIRAKKKEMHFFDLDSNYQLGLDWYQQRMPYSSGDQVTIEKTPGYFTAEMVPQRVFHMNNTIKLIVVVRDPVARTVSDYAQIYSNKLSKGENYSTFDEVVMMKDNQTINSLYRGIIRSLYYDHLVRWLNCFNLKQIHFVNAENLVVNPYGEVRKVERFLDLEPRISPNNFFFNATRGFFCIRNDSKQKCLSSSKGRRHPNVSQHVLQALRDFFKPHNHKFYQLVGINFGWS